MEIDEGDDTSSTSSLNVHNMNNQQLRAMLAQAQRGMAAETKTVVEFKAGLLTQQGTTVTADPRRGTVKLLEDGEGTLHLQWIQRPHGELDPTNDIVLTPNCGKWEKVPAAGRVYLLRLNSNRKKKFFWMQEPSDEKDEEYAKLINDAISKPRPGTQSMPPSQLAQLLTNSGDQSQEQGQANNQALIQHLAQLMAQQQQSITSLSSVLDSSRVLESLSDEVVNELLTHLPEGQQTQHGFRETLRSPQLRQTLDRLTGVLNGSQFNVVMSSLGLPRGDGNIGTDSFLDAVQAQADSENAASDNSNNSDGDKQTENQK